MILPLLLTQINNLASLYWFCFLLFFAYFIDPWTMALSKSANQKYFYNTLTKESTFSCPLNSMANCRLVE